MTHSVLLCYDLFVMHKDTSLVVSACSFVPFVVRRVAAMQQQHHASKSHHNVQLSAAATPQCQPCLHRDALGERVLPTLDATSPGPSAAAAAVVLLLKKKKKKKKKKEQRLISVALLTAATAAPCVGARRGAGSTAAFAAPSPAAAREIARAAHPRPAAAPASRYATACAVATGPAGCSSCRGLRCLAWRLCCHLLVAALALAVAVAAGSRAVRFGSVVAMQTGCPSWPGS